MAECMLNVKQLNFCLKKVDENLQNLGLGKEFLYSTPKAQCTKGKVDKLDFIKIKNDFSGGKKCLFCERPGEDYEKSS